VFTAVTANPVEYAVAVDRYLDAAGISDASRRVYRIALTTWAWALVDRSPPVGDARRGAPPPVVPLAMLDDWDAEERLRRAFEVREAVTGARTANRELAILRSAIAWWAVQGWVAVDPTSGIRRRRTEPVAEPRLGEDVVRAVFALRAPLREQALWHAVYESGGGIERILGLDVSDLTPDRRRTRPGTAGDALHWRPGTARLLSLLVAGRAHGPVFLTDRRAPAGTAAADRCPVTGHGRLSYRRAAEVFAEATKGLDPAGRGWTLRQLQRR
jgi:hypothetical protein